MSALKIALLGPPEVDHQDRRLTFPDRKVLALLAYLATEGGMQERQKLTRLLWPESDMGPMGAPPCASPCCTYGVSLKRTLHLKVNHISSSRTTRLGSTWLQALISTCMPLRQHGS